MTIGELATLFNAHIGCDLVIVPLIGWERSFWYDDTGLPWVMPSPNLPTLDTAILYPGLCFLEGTNLSEGRGTTKPFELWGAPWLDGRGTAYRLNKLALEGVVFRSCHFTPTYGKYLHQVCSGVQVHIVDREALKPVLFGLHILAHLLAEYGDQFEWRRDSGDGWGSHPFIDWLAGTDHLRRQLEAKRSPEDILAEHESSLADFILKRNEYLIYS